MNPTKNTIFCGGNLEVVASWPSNSISAVLTDPPYGLEFMGKEWDKLNLNVPFSEKETGGLGGYKHHIRFGKDGNAMQQWHYQWAKAMLRITKPGGFLLCFGGTRTYHRLTCAIEDAGWEIRDCMMWLYGSGFPKSHNISKALDKAAGANRKIIGKRTGAQSKSTGKYGGWGNDDGTGKSEFNITIPASNLAQLWGGYGTALKPAWEPILVCMKPLDGTFAHNAETHGVAGLNIDGGRIGIEGGTTRGKGEGYKGTSFDCGNFGVVDINKGRWPANLILDEEAGAMLDKQSGISKSTGGKNPGKLGKRVYGKYSLDKIGQNAGGLGDSGGASRFFYCTKTSRKERNMGMEDCEDKLLARSGGAQGAENRGEKEYLQKHIGLNRVAVVKNNHPTVKPLALMKYLCTLLRMPSADQIILDPFLGSGTTGMACKELGINFIGIEKEPEYCEIAVKRIAAVPGQEITLHTDKPPVEISKPKPFYTEYKQSVINAASAALKKNEPRIIKHTGPSLR